MWIAGRKAPDPGMARELQITKKTRRDPLALVSTKDFRTRDVGAADPEQLARQRNVTLYCLDEPRRSAVFVETPEDLDLRDEAFYYQAQYGHAQRLFHVPYEELEALVPRIAGAPPPLTLLYSVGRCGSTLMTRMFNRIPGCLALSEPDVYTQLMALDLSESELRSRLETIVKLVCRGHGDVEQPSHVLLKFRAEGLGHVAPMQAVRPDANLLFMYREAEGFVRSAVRAFYSGSSIKWIETACRTPVLKQLLGLVAGPYYKKLERFYPELGLVKPSELVGSGIVGYWTLVWLSHMSRYVKLAGEFSEREPEHEPDRETGPIALRYEDLVAHPREFLGSLLTHLKIDQGSIEKALEELQHDAQASSSLSRSSQNPWEMDEHGRATVREFLQRHDTIRTPDYEALLTMQVETPAEAGR